MIAHQRSITRGRYAIVDDLDDGRWNSFVLSHPKGSVFHTPEMVDVFRGTRNNYPVALAAIGERGEVLALLVAVLVQTLPDPFGSFSSRSIFYAEPLCLDDEAGLAALEGLLAEHDARIRHRALFAEVRPLHAPGAEKEALLAAGYNHYDYLNYIMDVSRPSEVIWSSISKRKRENIKHAARHGVTVEDDGSEEAVEILYRFLRSTYSRARVPLADKSLFERAMRILGPRSMAKLAIAYDGERTPIGASIRLLYKKTAFEWYHGADRDTRLRPAECLTWHDLESSSLEGYQRYDTGGAGRPNVPYGVRDYKAKFGGQLVNFGRYQKVYSRWKMALAETIYGYGRRLIGLTNP